MSKTPVASIIMAAGRGSRLVPFTNTTPKPLAKIQGKTLLECTLDNLYELTDTYVIVVNYLKEQIINFIGNKYKGKPVIYAVQSNPKGGTLDSFRSGFLAYQQYVNQAQKQDNKEIFNDSDNIFSNCNLKEALSFDYKNAKAAGYVVSCADNLNGPRFFTELKDNIIANPNRAVLVAKKYENKERLSEFGVLVVDANNNFIKMVEKPAEYVSDLVNLSIYYLPTDVASFIPEMNTKKQKEAISNNKEELLPDLINAYHAKKPMHVVHTDDYFYTVTNMNDLNICQSLNLLI